MKQLVFAGLFAGLCFFVWKGIQSPSAYLKKTSRKIIETATGGSSPLPGGSNRSADTYKETAVRIERIIRYVHFDIVAQAEYEGRSYSSRSLNEFRSLLSAWFMGKPVRGLRHENLLVHVKPDKKTGRADFDIYFKKERELLSCKVSFDWLKEKKWRVKSITVNSCSAV